MSDSSASKDCVGEHLLFDGFKFCPHCGDKLAEISPETLLDAPIPRFGLPGSVMLSIHHLDSGILVNTLRLTDQSLRSHLLELFKGVKLDEKCSIRVYGDAYRYDYRTMDYQSQTERYAKIQNYLERALKKIGSLYLGYLDAPFADEIHFGGKRYLKTQKEARFFESPDVEEFDWKFEELYQLYGNLGNCQVFGYANNYLKKPASREVYAHIRRLRFSLMENLKGIDELCPDGDPIVDIIANLSLAYER